MKIKSPYTLALMALAFTVPLIAISDMPLRDVLTRYAPMAEAIVNAQWDTAFHPRVPLLFPLSGAIICLVFNCDGFMGVKIAGALFFALSFFPLWGILRRVFDEKIAFAGGCCMLFCAYLLQLAASGLRENAKLFMFLLSVYALILIYQNRRKLSGYLILGVSLSAMVMIRDDSLLVAVCMGICALFFEIIVTKIFPWRTLLCAVVGLMVLSPSLAVNYAMTGYPVVSFRFVSPTSKILPAYVFGKNLQIWPEEKINPSITALTAVKYSPNALKSANSAELYLKSAAIPDEMSSDQEPNYRFFKPVTLKTVADYIDSIAKGLYFIFAIPAVIMIWLRRKNGDWTKLETLLFWAWLGHTLLVLLQIIIADRYLYVSDRYLLPAAPLAFGWTGLAFYKISALLKRYFSLLTANIIIRTALTLLAAVLLFDAFKIQLRERFSSRYAVERATIFAWENFIKNDYHGDKMIKSPQYNYKKYSSLRRPLIAGELPEIGYFVGGESRHYTPSEFTADNQHFDYLIFEVNQNNPAPVIAGYELLDIRKGRKKSFGLWRNTNGE